MTVISEFEQSLRAEGLERVELGHRYGEPEDATILNLNNYPPYLKLGQTMLKMEVQERGKLEAITFSIFTENSIQHGETLSPDRSVTLPAHPGKRIWLGREAGENSLQNRVQINDPIVSRRHAVIDTLGSVSLLRDLDSTNGTVLYVHPRPNYDKKPITLAGI